VTSRHIAAAGILLLALQAFRSDGYYFPDEYFQTVEFASLKLGVTPPAAMPWEHAERMRPFVQPALYYAVARGLRAVGASRPSQTLLALRLLSAALTAAAILALGKALGARLPEPRRSALLGALFLSWFVPFFFVRTSSEAVSGALLALALAAWLGLERSPGRAALLAGLALGAAFEVRFQTAFAAAGLGAWLALQRRAGARALAALVGGFAIVVLAGALVDRWGYGAWTFTPWNYVRVNLVEGKAAALFGTEPPWFYLRALAEAHAPLSTLLLLTMLLFWWRAPRHPLTWMTLPFLVAHSAVAHKELRFLVPAGLLAAAMAALLALDPAIPLGRVRESRWTRGALRTVVALDLVLLVVLWLVPIRHELSVQHSLRELALADPGARVLVIGPDPFVDKSLTLGFLRPAGWAPEPAASWADADARTAGAARAYVVSPLGQLPPDDLRARRAVRVVAAAAPEWAARALRGPIRRTLMRGVWELGPELP
jgi:phosphatidylinositol glycan class B